MHIDEVLPSHCHARARRALAEIELIAHELGRTDDRRPLPEISGAAPREVYFAALGLWHKADRVAAEVGANGAPAPAGGAPLIALEPGHVLRVIDTALERLFAIKARLGINDVAVEPAAEAGRQPSDVLVVLVQASRALSRALERPFTPADVFHQVALAARYAGAIAAARTVTSPAAARFERGRRPADCYQRLLGCLTRATGLARRDGHDALAMRSPLDEITPGDVYDLATVVLGEVAFVHAATPGAAPVHAFDPTSTGHRLPAHVYQLASTLEHQLIALGD